MSKPVFLEAAVGFFGDGAFDDACVEGGVEVVFAEGWSGGRVRGRPCSRAC